MRKRRLSPAFLVIAATAAAAIPAIGGSLATGAVQDYHEIPGLGDQARQLSNGLFEIKLDDGTLLQTHGFDPASTFAALDSQSQSSTVRVGAQRDVHAEGQIEQLGADPVSATDGPIATVDAPIAAASDSAGQTEEDTINSTGDLALIGHAAPRPSDGVAPQCAASSGPAFLLVYAYPKDAPAAVKSTGNQKAQAEKMRSAIYQANQVLYDDGSTSSKGETTRLYNFRCNADTTLKAVSFQSDTTKAQDSFDLIVESARRHGLTDGNTKYVIFYDDLFTAKVRGITPCGLSELRSDSSKSTGNASNHGAEYSAVFAGCLDPNTFMHEMGHNMGAVQANAPHATTAGHCVDELDVMCYDDGGTGGRGMTTRCPQEHYDCNFDDYYDTKTEPGEYLASHWNQGWTGNAWLKPIAPAKLSINDVSVQEGDMNETTYARFTVSLSQDLGTWVQVDYGTSDGTATSPDDYATTSGNFLAFPPGTTKKTISVPVHGDIWDEADETFRIDIYNATGAIIAKSKGTGTIVNDDTGFRTVCRQVLGPNPICDTHPGPALTLAEALVQDSTDSLPDGVEPPDIGQQ